MNQKSTFASSSKLLLAVQLSVATGLVAAIFVVSTQRPEEKTVEAGPLSGQQQTLVASKIDSQIAHAHYQTDGSQPTIAQCKFDDQWSAPQTDIVPPGATPEVLRWGSNVVDEGLGVTAPLSIQPTERVAQLPVEFSQDYVAPPSYVSTPTNEEVGGWGSLTPEEVEMIERQRRGDIGIESIDELTNDFPSDEFDSSDWRDPVSEVSVQPPVMLEPTVEATVVESDFPGSQLSESEMEELSSEGLLEEPVIDEAMIEELVDEPVLEEAINVETTIEGPGSDKLLETTTPLIDPVLEESTRQRTSEDYGNDFIPLTDLPTDEPEQTPEEKERAELELAPLPKFKKSKDVVGEFDEPVLKIKSLPDLDGKKNKKLPPVVKRAQTNPTWWAQQIHQPQLPGRQQLVTTLDEVIFMALRAAPQIQVLNTQPQIQQAALNEVTADFDWSTFVNSTWNDTNDPIGSTLTAGGSANQFIQREWVFESGLRKRLKSGGDLTIGQNFGTLENNSTFLTPPNQGNSRLVLDYRQPLLRGAGPSFNSSQIALADLDFQSISSESLAELQGYLVDVVAAYWDIYLRRAVLVQNRQSVSLAQELLRQLKSRKGIDVRNDQLLRAEAAVGARRSAMIRSEYDLINSQDTLINLVMGANSETVDQIELLPEQMMLPMGLRVESEQLVQAAIRNRPEVRAAIMQIRSSAIRKQIAANQLLPQLDAVVSSYVSGLRGNRSFTGAFGDQFSTGAPSYTVGFQFEVPLGNRAAKSRLQRSQFEAQVFHRQFEKQVGDVVLDARIAGREIERLNRENENNFNALQKAAQELDLIQQRQQLNLDDRKTGSLYIEDLLASQARLTAAESRLAQSQISQAIALVDLKRATGELLRSGREVHQPVPYEAVPFESTFDGNGFAQAEDQILMESGETQMMDGFNYPTQGAVSNSTQGEVPGQSSSSFDYPTFENVDVQKPAFEAPARNSDGFAPNSSGFNYPIGAGY